MSCASFQNSTKNSIEAFHNSWPLVCWNSEGKGRVEILSKRYLFDYEGLHEKDKMILKMAIQLPMGGEEIIQLNYSKAKIGKVLTSGSFYSRVMASLSKRSEKLTFQTLLHKWGKLMLANPEDLKKSKISWMRRDGHFTMTSPLAKNKIFKLDAYAKEKFYKRLIISLGSENHNSKDIKVTLFPSKCYIE